jgi:hypothetical protein
MECSASERRFLVSSLAWSSGAEAARRCVSSHSHCHPRSAPKRGDNAGGADDVQSATWGRGCTDSDFRSLRALAGVPLRAPNSPTVPVCCGSGRARRQRPSARDHAGYARGAPRSATEWPLTAEAVMRRFATGLKTRQSRDLHWRGQDGGGGR